MHTSFEADRNKEPRKVLKLNSLCRRKKRNFPHQTVQSASYSYDERLNRAQLAGSGVVDMRAVPDTIIHDVVEAHGPRHLARPLDDRLCPFRGHVGSPTWPSLIRNRTTHERRHDARQNTVRGLETEPRALFGFLTLRTSPLRFSGRIFFPCNQSLAAWPQFAIV